MLALLSIPSLLTFFQFYSVQKYFAINMELFSKDMLFSCFFSFDDAVRVS